MLRISFLVMLVMICFHEIAAQPQLTPAVLTRLHQKQGIRVYDSLNLIVHHPEGASQPLKALAYRVLQQYQPAGIFLLRVSFSELELIKKEAKGIFIDVAAAPKEELTSGSQDISLNKLNLAHQQYPDVLGNGIRISIKEQRFDTADIDFSSRYFSSGLAANTVTTHAGMMATLAAGAGNSSPAATGAAPEAMLTAASFLNLLPDPDSVFRNYSIYIQNHSYGTVVENRYGAEALAYDVQVNNNPALLHVFSAGNSGTNPGAGPYNGLPGWANLTGNFKYAKNVLIVGALDSFGKMAPQSSRGPAFDGRVKPELVAFGGDGSSGAAALVSGAAALVQQAYRQAEGKLPDAALVKAVLINSASDAGAENVDHQTGWGNLDGRAAVKATREKRYALQKLAKEDSSILLISVPERTRKLKVTICWTDAPAAIAAEKALVNDVDAVLTHLGNGSLWLPWVLSANGDSLSEPAHRGIDTVNNTEQITVDFPIPGNYELRLDGSKLSMPEQIVAISWQTDSVDAFLFTHPAPGQSLEIGVPALLRWQTQLVGVGTLQYAQEGGAWQTIATDVNLSDGYIKWIPQTAPQEVRLRMLLPGGKEHVSEAIILSPTILLQVGFRCGDSTLLYWKKAGLDKYQLYRLGAKMMEPLQAVLDSFIVIKDAAPEKQVYSIAPLIAGKPGLRSFSLNAATSGVHCYLKGFYVVQQINQSVVLQAELGSNYNLASIQFQKHVPGGFVTLRTLPSTNLSPLLVDSLLLQGANQYRLKMILNDGRIIESPVLTVYHFGSLPVQAFPNPVAQNNQFTLLTQLPGKYFVELFDLYGRKLMHMQLNSIATTLPARFRSGVYLLRVRSDDGIAGVIQLVVL